MEQSLVFKPNLSQHDLREATETNDRNFGINSGFLPVGHESLNHSNGWGTLQGPMADDAAQRLSADDQDELTTEYSSIPPEPEKDDGTVESGTLNLRRRISNIVSTVSEGLNILWRLAQLIGITLGIITGFKFSGWLFDGVWA